VDLAVGGGSADAGGIDGEGVPVSTVTGVGLERLRRAAAQRVFADRVALADLEPALTRARHRTALERARAGLAEAREQLGHGEAVLAAHHLREATAGLDELVGAVDIEDVLDQVFRSFCIGK
jgi:tRNA modification GTPase